MLNSRRFFVLIALFTSQLCTCYSRDQRYNTNLDFLLHESGGIAAAPKSDGTQQSQNYNPTNTQNNNDPSKKRDYVAQFPTLKPPSSTSLQPKSNVNIGTTPKPVTPPKRDYVAPQFPTLKPVSTTSSRPPSNINSFPGVTLRPTNPQGPKRDYVAPQFPNHKQDNNQQTTGKVKDLVNFYDNKNPSVANPTRMPSYSSILKGPTNGPGQTSSTVHQSTLSTPSPATKPMSFSSVVSGSHKQGLPSTTNTTPKPVGTTAAVNSPPKPGSPVLPSSLLTNNNNQGSNSNSVSDLELQSVSEELFRKDTNNAAKHVTINYQEKTTSMSTEDKAPLPLLTVAPAAWNIPTIQKLLPLLDNYERDTSVNEHVTAQERNEENAFMDVIMATPVIRYLMNFLKDKGYVSPDPKQQRDFLKQLWFGLYSRGKGKISSSGFEHVFLSEVRNGGELGLHNWVYFSKEETANRLNYLGYMKYLPLSDKGAIVKIHFNHLGADKPVNTLFIGTSPELEMALYSLCFVTRLDQDCKLKLNNKDVDIVTHSFRYRSKNYIGSAYPNW